MKKYKATKFEKGVIELTSSEKLEELYQTIEKEENFVLEWKEGDVSRSKLIVATDMMGKIKTGDIELCAVSTGWNKK